MHARFYDHYKHIHATLRSMNIGLLTTEEIQEMAISFRQTIDDTPLLLNTCTVKIDLTDMGIPAGMCIDRELVERITGYPISTRKDKNQRTCAVALKASTSVLTTLVSTVVCIVTQHGGTPNHFETVNYMIPLLQSSSDR